MPFARPKKSEPLDEAQLHDYALKSLGRRMRTEADLRKSLRAKVEPDEYGSAKINTVIQRLKEYGYLDDAGFAETYTRLRQENQKFGQRRVKQDLQLKGVPKPIADEAIAARYEEINEETLARQHLERKRIKKPENEKETARVMRRLVAAGFSTGTIHKILRQWDLPDASLEALENLGDLGEEPGAEE